MSTIFLARFLGVFYVIFALGILFNREHITEVASDITAHPASQLTAGMIPLLLGIWVVIDHNIWMGDWGILVTISGWIMLVGGVFRLWFVKAWVDQVEKNKESVPIWGGLIVLIMGILLIYAGFYH